MAGPTRAARCSVERLTQSAKTPMAIAPARKIHGALTSKKNASKGAMGNTASAPIGIASFVTLFFMLFISKA